MSRYQTYITFTADGPEDALRKIANWRLSRGAEVQGVVALPDPVEFHGFPVQTDDEGHIEVPDEPERPDPPAPPLEGEGVKLPEQDEP